MSAEPRELFARQAEGPGQRGCTELDRRSAGLTGALRRGFPFIVRRGVPITADPAEVSSFEAIEAELGSPRHVIHLETDPGHRRGALFFDTAAIAYVFDGALGGDGSSPPSLSQEELTGPQCALMARTVAAGLAGLSGVFEAATAFKLKTRAAPEDAPNSDELIVLKWRIGVDGIGGTIVLALDRAAFQAAPVAIERSGAPDPVLVAALSTVPLEMIAELGRVRMTLRALSALRVGDAITIPVPVDGVVPVRVEGKLLFEGRPTTSGARVAIRVVRGTPLDAVLVDSDRKQASP